MYVRMIAIIPRMVNFHTLFFCVQTADKALSVINIRINTMSVYFEPTNTLIVKSLSGCFRVVKYFDYSLFVCHFLLLSLFWGKRSKPMNLF